MRRSLAPFFLLIALFCASAQARVPVYGYRVVKTYPHDTSAYTEGLFYKDGYLYESTGEPGESSVRKVELATGKVVQRYDLPPQYFGEGIIDWHGALVQLTWRQQLGIVYDLATLSPRRTFNYPGEGWALTRDDRHIYMSDGTPRLRVLDPKTLQAVAYIDVTADGKPVQNVNELEWVEGKLYANIWLTRRIAIIDPHSGRVTAWIDLKGIDAKDRPGRHDPDDVLNGIAYDAKRKRLFVTGKHWPRLYQIELVKQP